MRPFPQNSSKHFLVKDFAACGLLVAAALCVCGCANVASAPSPAPPPTNEGVSITIKPGSGSVMLGNQLTFAATVENAADTTVSWSVNGVAGGTSFTGTVSSGGVYTAPAGLPIPASVQVTAVSHADATKSATAAVAIQSDIVVALGPGVGATTVELGATKAFQAFATSSAGHPDKTVQWSVSGPACPLCLRLRGLQWELYRAANFAIAAERHAHGAQPGGSREAGIHNRHHHQQFLAATFCAVECRCRSDSDVCCHAHARAGIKSQQRAGVEFVGQRVQWRYLRNADGGNHAIRGRQCHRDDRKL